MKTCKKALSILTAILLVTGLLPVAARADLPDDGTRKHTAITLEAGSVADYWSNALSYLIQAGDRNGTIRTDDNASAGETGAVYQKILARSKLFDQAFTKADGEETYDITVQKGETFYIAVKHDIRSSGRAYLTGFDATFSYTAGAFSPMAIGGQFGSHPANRMMSRTILSDGTANVQQAALKTGLLSRDYGYTLTQEQENGKEGVCVSLSNPDSQKPPVASQTQWDVLIPLTANRAGVYTIKYTGKIGSLESCLWYADQLLADNNEQVTVSKGQMADGTLTVNDIRIRVLSDGPELTAEQTAIQKECSRQITLKLNKDGSFHEAACTSSSVWNSGVLSGGTVTAVQKVTTGLAQRESAIRLTIDTSGVSDDSILIIPNASITSDYADCGWVSLDLVTAPEASVDLSADTGAVLLVGSATDRYKIKGDIKWTVAGAKAVPLTGNAEQNGPLDRLQAAVSDGAELSDAITVISKQDDPTAPAAAKMITVSRAAAPVRPSIDYLREIITGIPLSSEYAFGSRVPDSFTDAASSETTLTGQETGSSLYYRTKPIDAQIAFPSHVQTLFIPERPVLQPVSAKTSVLDKELGYTTLQAGGEGGLEYALNAGQFTDLTDERVRAADVDTITVRRKATETAYHSNEQQLTGEGFSYGTVTARANHGTTTVVLHLKDNGVTFKKAESTPVEVAAFDKADGSKIKSLKAVATSAAGDTTMRITLKQSGGKNTFDSRYGYYTVVPIDLLSDQQEVNQHKTLGESGASARGLVEIALAEEGHRIVACTAAATTGSGSGIPYSIDLSESFLPSGGTETKVTVLNLREGEQIQSVTVNGAAVSITDISYDTATGAVYFLYPPFDSDEILDIRLSLKTKPVVKPLSAADISWDVGNTTKIYDGTSTAPENITPSCSSASLYGGHSDIQIKAAAIDFVSADGTKTPNTGTGLKIVASGITLAGTDSAYYTLPESLSMTLASGGSITKAKTNGFSLASSISVQGGAVNASELIDKIIHSKVHVHTDHTTKSPPAVPLSDFIGGTEDTAVKNRITGALFTYTREISDFEVFLNENLNTAMAILSVTPATGDDSTANSVKDRQAVAAAVTKLDNPDNSGQAAVMRSLLQAYLGSLKIGTTFAFELSAAVLLSPLPEGNYDLSALQSGISGSIAVKAEGDLDDDGETNGDLFLVVYEIDPTKGSLKGDSAQKIAKGKTPESVPAVTAKNRYTFEGWLLNGEEADPADITVTADISFTASFTKGFMHGDGNGGVRPGNEITRAEFVKMAVYAFGSDFEPNTAYDVSMYTDVPETQWYRAVIGYATEKNWISGHEGKFRPNDKITRQEASKLVAGAMGAAPGSVSSMFTDASSISGWAVPYISSLTQRGVLGGYEDGSFQPLRNISRAEAASMVGKANGFQPDERRRETIRSTVTLPFSDIGSAHWSYPDIAYACGAVDQ